MTVTGKVQKFRMREIAVEELGLHEAARDEDGVVHRRRDELKTAVVGSFGRCAPSG